MNLRLPEALCCATMLVMKPKNALIPILGAGTLVLLSAGCASEPSAATNPGPPTEPVISVGPPAEAPDQVDDSSVAIEPDRVAGSDTARTDGRPAWWIDQPQQASGRLYLSVEALGEDVRSARRAAVDSGIGALTRMLGHYPADDKVHATTVRPLPHRGGTNEGMRYIGFVLVSAEAPD